MAQKMIHYDIHPLMKVNADWNILYGERSNGKSYQAKYEIMFAPEILEGDKRFILVWRYDDDMKNAKLEKYFEDVDVSRLTDGKYNTISIYRKEVYLANYISTRKMERGKKIGYCIPLQHEGAFAGSSYLDVDNMIYEEFMPRDKPYLYQEPDKLMNLYCTVDRKQKRVKVWMIGNTISRVCPYLYDWDLYPIVRKQEQGTIEIKEIPVSEYGDSIKLAIEHCKATGQTSFTIGKHSAMLNSGEWQSDPQPHLRVPYKDCRLLCRCIFQYSGFGFIGEYLTYNGDKFWFVYPKTRQDIYGYIYVFSDQIRESKTWACDPYHSNTRNPVLQRFFDDFREDKIFYSTDLDGTEFKQAINFEIRR